MGPKKSYLPMKILKIFSLCKVTLNVVIYSTRFHWKIIQYFLAEEKNSAFQGQCINYFQEEGSENSIFEFARLINKI